MGTLSATCRPSASVGEVHGAPGALPMSREILKPATTLPLVRAVDMAPGAYEVPGGISAPGVHGSRPAGRVEP